MQKPIFMRNCFEQYTYYEPCVLHAHTQINRLKTTMKLHARIHRYVHTRTYTHRRTHAHTHTGSTLSSLPAMAPHLQRVSQVCVCVYACVCVYLQHPHNVYALLKPNYYLI